MAVSLSKGANVSLRRIDPGIRKAVVGLGWDAHTFDGSPFDLDTSVFMVNHQGRVRHDEDFLFYNHLESPDGSVIHSGDNRTGEGDGDDEVIYVDLLRVPTEITKLIFAVTIHNAGERQQHFGMVDSAFIRIINDDTERELLRYNLSQEAKDYTALIFGELYRYRNEWKFRAVEQGFKIDLAALARSFGVEVADE